ncbi:hypothetical protein [Fusobacterium sp.]|uniref:hypothetical protein n=1 Tax=Fusobacterium sp. TaxID=68766 RepID=UPI0026303CD9|nr:hypothetical protein [Fusobacterium sp.]
MIKLNKNKFIEREHKKWFDGFILSKLEDKIKEKEKLNLDSKYIKFLNRLKDVSIADNFKMLKLIEEFEKLENKNNYIKELKEIFDYDFFSKRDPKNWGRHKLITSLKIKVCPYCQRNYISSYEENESKSNKTTADLDHFYPKAEYPFLALSLYNFIPSCQICNSRMKGKKSVYDRELKKNKIVHPYEDDFKGIFKTEDKILEVLLGNESEFKVIIDSKNDVKTSETISMLKLDKVYERTHNDYLLNMIENIKNKPETYLESIAELFINENIENKEKIKEIVLKNLKELVIEPYKFKVENKEPLAKLTKDILEEFGIEI